MSNNETKKVEEEQSTEKKVGLDKSLPEPTPPEKPLPGDCCGSGCVRCVWDVYYEELEDYNNQLQTLSQSQSKTLLAAAILICIMVSASYASTIWKWRTQFEVFALSGTGVMLVFVGLSVEETYMGVTEAGEGEDARIKSAVCTGTLLQDGLGDTSGFPSQN